MLYRALVLGRIILIITLMDPELAANIRRRTFPGIIHLNRISLLPREKPESSRIAEQQISGLRIIKCLKDIFMNRSLTLKIIGKVCANKI